MRPPDLMSSAWRCDIDGEIAPLHIPQHVGMPAVELVRADSRVPVWLPWPPLTGWTVTGVAWAGDDRSGRRATAVACTGPAPLGGAADVVLVAEELGVGLGAHYAGLAGPDPGGVLLDAVRTSTAHAKVRAAGHPTPLWSIPGKQDRCVYVGEAGGLWLWAILWPAEAGYVLLDHVELVDLREQLPSELVFGALSPYLNHPDGT